MNKIWVVEQFDDEGSDVIAIYSNEEAANTHVERITEHKSLSSSEYAVGMWSILDEAPEVHWVFAISDLAGILGNAVEVRPSYHYEGEERPLKWSAIPPSHMHMHDIDFAGGWYVEGPDPESVKAKYDELHAGE